jgi:phosphoglycerol transferase MdoB-like AlkP superfamily enzyme
MFPPRLNKSTEMIMFYKSRFSLLGACLLLYIALSSIVRLVLFIWSFRLIDFDLLHLLKVFFVGLVFDLTIGLAFVFLYALYLLVFPKRWIGTWADKSITYLYLAISLFVMYFSLMAEFPFWEEFGVRFNFIAVDYLIYTYEVVSNINQSYPLPLIFLVLIGLVAGTFVLFRKRGVFQATFSSRISIVQRTFFVLPMVMIFSGLLWLMNNSMAETSSNLTLNELGKNGVFSFVSAYRSNELDFDTFYPTIPEKEAYATQRSLLLQHNQQYTSADWNDISRNTTGDSEMHPNIILIVIESFSASFSGMFGNQQGLTPSFDSISKQGVFFSNLYATGTRTVRGMEALTLCLPPTPGNSIVRRPHNAHLYSIATVLNQKNYRPYFIYGGDGYFDNMNNFFAGQGFSIVDRNRGNPLSESIATNRFNIPDTEVSFENAWGICDEDLYKQSIKYADLSAHADSPFFQFIMTTSNHKPYTFPSGKINMRQGDRDAAVRYTDYALGAFLSKARTKPWFKNTVFVIVADHCASSAGKWEINVDKHHIPAVIWNAHQMPQQVNRLVSQIDLMPTLFGYLNWNYCSRFYGVDINQINPSVDRAFLGNYRTLGMMKANVFTQIDDRRHVKQFLISDLGRMMTETKNLQQQQVVETIAGYQTASHRFKTGKMGEH